MRRPSATQLVDQLDDLIASLRVAQQVVPYLAGQARLEHRELSGGLPANPPGVGADHSDEPAPGWPYTDPTGEAVVNQRPVRDGSCDPGRDLERLARWYGDVTATLGSTRRLLNQAPAVTLAVVAGRNPTDGRTQEEHDQRRFVRALNGSRCEIAEDHEDTEPPFGPGQLRAGMCDRHRKQFGRWQDRNSASLFGMTRADMVTRWRAQTWPEKWEGSSVRVDPGVYKDMRRVA